MFRFLLRHSRVLLGLRGEAKNVGGVHTSALGAGYATMSQVVKKNQISNSNPSDTSDIFTSPLTVSIGENSAEHDGGLFKPFTPEEDLTKFQEGTFQYLFENSQFVKAMDPVGKEVEAEILAVVGDKIYVDFGCKFHAVIPLPEKNRERYSAGAKVIIIVNDVEVTGHFIGDNRHQSLLEAEAELVRLVA